MQQTETAQVTPGWSRRSAYDEWVDSLEVPVAGRVVELSPQLFDGLACAAVQPRCVGAGELAAQLVVSHVAREPVGEKGHESVFRAR